MSKKFEDVTCEDRLNALEDMVNEHCEELELLDSFTDNLEVGVDEHEEELAIVDARLNELEKFMEVVSEKLGLNLQKIFDESFNASYPHPKVTL